IVLVALVLYSAGRTYWIETHFRSALKFDRNLQLELEAKQLGLSAEHKLTAVNGQEVQAADDVLNVYDATDAKRATYLFQDGDDQPKQFEYIMLPPPFDFRVRADGVIEMDEHSRTTIGAMGPDSRVEAVNGVAISSLESSSDRTLIVPEPEQDVSSFIRFTLAPTGEVPSKNIVVEMFNPYMYRGRLLTGILFLLVCLLVIWIRPDTKSSLGFLIFTMSLGLFFVLRSVPSFHRFGTEKALYLGLQCALPATTLAFVFTFTPLRSLVRRPSLWLWPAVIYSVVLCVSSVILFPKDAQVGLLGFPLFRFWGITMLLILVLSLPMDWWLRLFKIPLSATDKQRSRILRYAIFIGFAPSVFLTTQLFYVIPSFSASPYTPFVEATTVLFPLIVAYAIIRLNLLRLNQLAWESLAVGVLVAGTTLLYVGTSSLIVPTILSFVPDSSEEARTAILAVSLFVVLPMYNVTRRAVERRYSRVPFEFDEFIATLDEAVREVHSSGEFCRVAAERIRHMVKSANVTIFVHDEKSGEWSLNAITPEARTALSPDSCRLLLELVAERKHEIFLDEALELIEYQPVRDELVNAFRLLDASVIIPIMGRDQLEGAIALGGKADQSNYSAPELKTLARIARHIGSILHLWQSGMPAVSGPRIVDRWPVYPKRIGGFDITGTIGRGGMAYVYLAERHGVKYALKMANRSVQDSPILMERFQREATVMQRIQHENVLPVVEVGWEGPEAYIALEYFAEGSLQEQIDKGQRFTIAEVLSIALQVARGLAAAHQEGVVHRDIKPQNIFRAQSGLVKISDFGLAAVEDRTTLTETGHVFGTPDFIAPEVVEGEKATHLSDQYALGVTMFELLTGKRPFTGEKKISLLFQRVSASAPDLRSVRPDVPQPVAEIVAQLLERSPAKRYRVYDDLLDELRRAMKTV
ncbi:MAG: protein kinase, partial [Candidatus Hydrogenedentota bacterium]